VVDKHIHLDDAAMNWGCGTISVSGGGYWDTVE